MDIALKQRKFVDECVQLCSEFINRSDDISKLKASLKNFLESFLKEIKDLQHTYLEQLNKLQSQQQLDSQLPEKNLQLLKQKNQMLKLKDLQVLNDELSSTQPRNHDQDQELENLLQEINLKDERINSLYQQLELSNEQNELLRAQISKLEQFKLDAQKRQDQAKMKFKAKHQQDKLRYKEQYENLKQKGQEKIHKLKDMIIEYQTNLQTHFFEIGQLKKIIIQEQEEKQTIQQQLNSLKQKFELDVQRLETTLQERLHNLKNELSLKFLKKEINKNDSNDKGKYQKIRLHLSRILQELQLCKFEQNQLKQSINLQFPKVENIVMKPEKENEISREINDLVRSFETQMEMLKRRISEQMIYRKELDRSSVITTASPQQQRSQTPEEEQLQQKKNQKFHHSHTQSAICSPSKFNFDKQVHLSSYIMRQQNSSQIGTPYKINIKKNLMSDFEAVIRIKKTNK